MKKTFILSLVFSSFSLFLFSYKKEETYTLNVEVENLRNSKGVVQFALYNKEGSIPDEYFKNYYKLEKSVITDGKAEVSFTKLPEGKYVINVLHDENKNGKIDKGLILPKEGIGFSNYHSLGLTRRPNFSKASFDLKQNKKIMVKVIYM